MRVAPHATYEQLTTERVTGDWRRLAGRFLLTLAAIAIGVAVSATGRVSIGLVLTIAICWSFALVVQAAAAAVLILAAGVTHITTPRVRVGWTHRALPAIRAIHAQGGGAIAAHPTRAFRGWTDAAVAALDGYDRARLFGRLSAAAAWLGLPGLMAL